MGPNLRVCDVQHPVMCALQQPRLAETPVSARALGERITVPRAGLSYVGNAFAMVAWIASAAARGSPASRIGRPTTM